VLKRYVTFGVFGAAHHHSDWFASTVRRHPKAKLAGIYDADRRRSKAFAEKFSIPYFDDLAELFPEVQAGIVTCENVLKKDMCLALARAGKHILCDKPLGLDSKESEEIIRACRKNAVKLQVGYLSRYSPEALEAKRVVSSGRIGRLKFIVAENRVEVGVVKQLSPWLALSKKNGGKGAILEHSVHAADLAQWYVTSPAESVYAVSAKNLDPSFEVEDNFSLFVKYRNGAYSTIDGSYCRASSGRPGDVNLTMFGEKGEMSLRLEKKALELFLGEEPRSTQSLIQTKLGDTYEGVACWNMIDDLVDCILNDKEPLTCGEDALRINALVEAGYRSLNTGRVVKI